MDDTLLENLKNDVKNTTYNNYLVRIKTIKNIMNEATLKYIMTHPTKTIDALNKKFPGNNASVGNYITPITKLFTINPNFMKSYPKHYKKFLEELKKRRGDEMHRYKENKPTEKQSKNYVDYDEVKDKYVALKKSMTVYDDKQSNLEFVLLACLINLRPKRADLGNVLIVRKPPTDDETFNYMVLDKSPKLVINVHKTMHKHKAIIENINVELHEIVTHSLKAYPRKYLLVDNSGKPYTKNNSYTQFVRRVFSKYFGKNAGVSLWRHSFINQIDSNKATQNEMDEIAKSMGHTVGAQQIVYKWKNVDKNEICKTVCVKK